MANLAVAILGFICIEACATQRANEPRQSAQPIGVPTTAAQRRQFDPIWRITRIEQQFHGYGGSWFDKTGNLHTYTTNLADSAGLKAALADQFADWSPGDGTASSANRMMLFHQGKFSYRQLWNWRHLIGRVAVDSVPSYQSSGVRQQSNTVRFGVTAAEGIPGIERIAERLKIPRDAVSIEVEDIICTLEGRYGITVSPIDSSTGALLLAGSYIYARDGNFVDSLRVPSDWQGSSRIGAGPLARERAGVYEVGVDRDGYKPWRLTDVVVTRDACHVHRVDVLARLVRK